MASCISLNLLKSSLKHKLSLDLSAPKPTFPQTISGVHQTNIYYELEGSVGHYDRV